MMGLKKYLSNKKGQSMVEFALVLPIVLMLIFGIIEFGRIFNAYMIVNNASREGAREATLGRTYTEIETRISNVTTTLGTLGTDVNLGIDKLTNSTDSRVQGESVTVTVTHELTLVTPIIGPLLSDSEDSNEITISSSTSMRVE